MKNILLQILFFFFFYYFVIQVIEMNFHFLLLRGNCCKNSFTIFLHLCLLWVVDRVGRDCESECGSRRDVGWCTIGMKDGNKECTIDTRK